MLAKELQIYRGTYELSCCLLGVMKHTNEYAMKRMLVNTLDKSWYNHGYFSAHHHKFVKYKNKKKDENEN